MHKIDTPTAVAGQFVDKDPVNDVPGTVVDAEWLNAIQSEIINVVTADGTPLDKTNKSQLQEKIGATSVNDIAKLRTINPVAGRRFNLKCHTVDGDGGHGSFTAVTGAALGTYVDDNGTIVVPTGGDGSAAYLRDYSGPINVKWIGVRGGAVETTATLQAALDLPAPILIPYDSYLFSAKLRITLSGKTIYADKATLLKNYDGVGLEFENKAGYAYIYGDLEVKGNGVFAGDGSVASTSPNATGIEVLHSRVRVLGSLTASNHIGDGIRIISTPGGNGNKCDWNELWATSNNGKGIRCSGTTDDQSVWTLKWYTQYNFAGGVHLDDDYTGRQWEGLIYNEASTGDGVSDGVYLGKLLSSKISIYSEEQSTTGTELVIGANCANLRIEDQRTNTTINNTSDSCVTFNGGSQWLWGAAPSMGIVVAPNMNDASEKATKTYFGASSNVIAKEIVHGHGAIERQALQFSGTQQTNHKIEYNYITQESFGGELAEWNYSANGTENLPTAKIVGELAYKQQNQIYTGSDYHTSGTIEYEITSIGGGNKSSYDIVYKLTPNGLSALTEAFRIKQSGDIELKTAGKGIIVTSPDGLTQKRIGIDNTGSLSITAV